MREFFLKLFEENPATQYTGISLYSLNHILYVVVIFAIVTIVSVIFFKKDTALKEKVINIAAILVLISYLSDFFFHPFFNGGTMADNGEIILEKFPFHACTVLCPLIMFTRYSKYKNVIKTPIAILSVVVPLMWLLFPGSALDTDKSAFSYEIMQLFIYHGLVFAYGTLSIVLQESKLEIKKCYKEAILVVAISLWATLGNTIYSSSNHKYNWFFLKDPVFTFVPDSLNPYVVVVVVYICCLVIYGVYYLVIYLYNKLSRSKKINTKSV